MKRKFSWIPPQINEAERLDDPSIPLEERKAMLQEIDGTNTKMRLYPFFIFRFKQYLFNNIVDTRDPNKPLKILEIGSGSGGLAREIAKMLTGKINFEYHMLDIDPEILKWAKERMKPLDHNVYVHPANNQHLKQFSDNQFDVAISLHLLHHIQPYSELQDMFRELGRVTAKGFFMPDFERKHSNLILFGQTYLDLMGVSKALSADGIKSLKRAYTKAELVAAMKPLEEKFKVHHRGMFLSPFQSIWGVRKI